MKRIAVYTAIFGLKDKLCDPININHSSGIDYYCFTDDKTLTSKYYKVILKPALFRDTAKNARYFKIIGSRELDGYNTIIWHDANLAIRHDQISYLAEIATGGFLYTFKHPFRRCVYAEAIACIKLNKDTSKKIVLQITKYFFKGMPPDYGLFETSILLKKRQASGKNMMMHWWREVEDNSRRDQLSLPYISWLYDVKIGRLPGERERNKFSTFNKHLYSGYHVGNKADYKSRNYVKWLAMGYVKLLKRASGIRFFLSHDRGK